MSVAECSYTKASHHHMYVYMFNGMFVKKVGLVISWVMLRDKSNFQHSLIYVTFLHLASSNVKKDFL